MTMTIKEAHLWASSFLDKNGIENASLEAEILIRTLYGWDRSSFFLNIGETLSPEKDIILSRQLLRRINHEPLQYIIGGQDFYGRSFKVNHNVLIPRPETELLIEEVIKQAAYFNGNELTVADIGTGSGAIAITLALEKPDWTIYATDISQVALNLAVENGKSLKARVEFFQGFLYEPLISNKIKADIIVSNPPYIPSTDILSLMSEVKDYEPILALDGGADGMDFYRQLTDESQLILSSPGIMALEVGINQAKSVVALLENSGAKRIKLIKDFQGIERIVLGFY